ncbi:hypothetical protein ACOIPX_005040 [Salmonella enterica]|uniref:Uncharacterized protein n=1 Tax=Salmonella enterica TaxID=28901 RepID=A0A764VXS2_SALER|nr:hypothetical protein [Salmonella enterica]
MKTLIEIRRNRMINTKLESLMRHVGKPVQLANLSDGSRIPVELSPEILEKALIKLFESEVYKNKNPERAEKIITDHYSDCVGKEYSRLTSHGMLFMNAVIDELAERAFEKQEGIN